MRLTTITFILAVFAVQASAQTYPVIWTDLINVTVNAGNTITKTSGPISAWDAGAGSSNRLAASTDGFMQFTYASSASPHSYMLGLSSVNSDPNYTLTDYAFYANGGSLSIWEKGVSKGAFGTLANGDVLKVSREGLNIKYYKNNVVIFTTVLTSSAVVLQVDLALATLNFTVPAPVVSFNTRLLALKPQFTFPARAVNDGAITMVPEGGDAPYTYSWSTGATTASISGLARGNYTVTVTDAAGRTASRTYYLGYPVAWTNLDFCSVNSDGSLSRTTTGSQATGASSLNILPASTDGYIEFTATDIRSSAVIGFSDFDHDATLATLDFGLMISTNGSVFRYLNGATATLGTYTKGDVFKISKVAGNILFFRNGTQISTTSVAAAMSLMVDVYLPNNYGPTPVISSSFEKEIQIKPTITLPDNANANGSIALAVAGDYTPSTISWTPGGETTNAISGKSRGTYAATITDAAPRIRTKTYRLGYPVVWTDLQNVKVNPDNTIYMSGGSGWGAGATSSNILAPNTDGWMEIVINRSSFQAIIGLARVNSSANYNNIDYGFNISGTFAGGNALKIYENAALLGTFGYLKEGDVLTIAREGSNMKYYLNGVVIRTIATNPSYALVLDISFNVLNNSTPLISLSFTRTPQTFYTIANGNWTSPSIWSLTEGGPATNTYPGPGDTANIKGYNVTVNTGINTSSVNIITSNDNTALKIDTALGQLNVKGQLKVNGLSNVSTIKALQVLNNAQLNIVP